MVEILRRILFQEIPSERPASRLLDIDAARGLAIVLVVIGHVTSWKMPLGNHWYLILMILIYRFHMPLFMALTGITFALSLPYFRAWAEVGAFSIRRVTRLLIPYLVIGLVTITGKSVAQHFMHVDNPSRGFIEDVDMLLLVPTEGVARSLWFVYVLSIYLALIPALFYCFGRRPILLLVIALALQLGDWTEVLALNSVVYYLPFFAGGMILWIYRAAWSPMSPSVFWVSAVLFATVLALSIPLGIPKWLTGTLSVPAVIGLVQNVPSNIQSALGWLGRYSLSIYLFNGLAMGIVKGLLLKVLPWDGLNFLLYFPLLVMVGVALPLIVKRGATQWFPPVARYI
jgi:fucose 4-O-acetylase-like acetyltransferase